LVYEELRRLARIQLSHEHPGHTLRPTALVHEAWLRMIDQREVDWQNRAHFFGLAAQMIRRTLVDHARARLREKRGGGVTMVSLDESIDAPEQERLVDLIAIDEALDKLAKIDAEQSRLVELRFFGGLSVEETAVVMGSSTATIKREWAIAKSWLYRALTVAPQGRK